MQFKQTLCQGESTVQFKQTLCKVRRISIAFSLIATLCLAGCGGGGMGNQNPGSQTITGTAATGVAIVGQVIAIDTTGKTFTATTSATGAYTVDVTGGTAPFLLTITGTSSGNTVTWNSIATAVGQTVNITPLTDLIVSTAAGQPGGATLATLCTSTVPADQVSCRAALTAAATPANLSAAVTAVTNMIAPLNTTAANPLNGAFVGGSGTGMDAVLDAILVTPATAQGGTATVTLVAVPTQQLGTVTMPPAAGGTANPVTIPPTGYISQGGLTWSPANSTKVHYADAVTYCSTATFNGLSGWRLPTLTELSGLATPPAVSPSLPASSNTFAPGGLYASGALNGQGWTAIYLWSSTSTTDATFSNFPGYWGVFLANNSNQTYPYLKGTVADSAPGDWGSVTCVLPDVLPAQNHNIVGSWYGAGDTTAMITFFANGDYLQSQGTVAGTAQYTVQQLMVWPGVESGTYTWDSNTGAFASTCPTVDTNGSAGLSNGYTSGFTAYGGTPIDITTCTTKNKIITVSGNTMTVVDPSFTPGVPASTYTMIRVINAYPGVGSWYNMKINGVSAGTGTSLIYTFFANLDYMQSQSISTGAGTMPGLEHGTFTLNTGTGAFASVCPTIDTNGTAGLSAATGTQCVTGSGTTGMNATVSVSGNMLTVTNNLTPGTTYTFDRVMP
jgi:hypothetical protein